MSEVLQQYLQTVLRAAIDRRSLLPLLALLLGGGGAAALWRSATTPIRVEGEPVFKRKRHQELKDGVLHSHGDGQIHAHGDGGCCDEPDADAEAAFREVLRSLVAAGKNNKSELGTNVFAYLVSIFARTWVTVRLAMATGVLAGHFASLRWPMFFRSHFTMAMYALPMAALNAAGNFLEKRVALSVRTILFDRLNDKYTEAKLARFYRLALPDTESTEGVTSAPQTLTTELALLSDELVHHVGHLISPVMNIAYLSVVLRRSLGAAPLLCYLGYFCVATALIEKVKRGSARACGGTLAAAIAEGQQLESELRERCSKVHNNREEIAMLRGGKSEGLAIKGRFYSLLRHLYMQWGAHAVVDCAREFLLQHGGTLMGYMVMVPTLYMATKGGAMPAVDAHGHSHGATASGGVHSHGASGFTRMRAGSRASSPLHMRAVHGDHSHGNSMESPLALLFGAGAVDDDHAHGDDGHGHSHGGIGDIAEMMVANSQLLASLAGSILELSETYKCGSIVRGLSRRIKTMEAKMDILTSEIPAREFIEVDDSSEHVKISHLNVAAPVSDGDDLSLERRLAAASEGTSTSVLIHDLNLEVKRGQHTLVRGRNGVGKTSLFRTLGGLWKPVTGNATTRPLTLPKDMIFVPQKTYLTDGTLREQLAYPDAVAAIDNPGNLDDKSAAEVLQKVGLDDLLSRYSLDTPEEWETVLSGGEKQRIAWARLFLRRPSFALLDEASAGVSIEKLEDLYATAMDYGITLVTISHEPAVERFHTQTVELKGSGEWEIVDSGEVVPAVEDADA